MAVAIDLEMQVRAGGEAGRAAIADHLAAADVLAAAHRDAAHMAIAGAETAAVAELHIIAAAAGAAAHRPRAVGRCMDPPAIPPRDSDPPCHPLLPQHRMAPHTVPPR